MIDSKDGQLICAKIGPSSESTWNVHIEELLILYFLNLICNSKDYLSPDDVLLCGYESV